MQAEGHWKDARLQEMSNIMPAGFVLESVARVTVGGDKGGVPIEVALAPENVFGSLEGYGVGSM